MGREPIPLKRGGTLAEGGDRNGIPTRGGSIGLSISQDTLPPLRFFVQNCHNFGFFNPRRGLKGSGKGAKRGGQTTLLQNENPAFRPKFPKTAQKGWEGYKGGKKNVEKFRYLHR